MRPGQSPGWLYYLGAVVVQLLVIGLTWASASIQLFKADGYAAA